jgi:RimJ/RimL family protein N-acetyltransferase
VNSLPSGLKLRFIDAELLENATLPQLEEVRGEIESGWTSVERFLQEGIGCCVVHEIDGVVCWCTAEYVSSGKCGVGIETVESYQEQGLATVAASAFVQQAASRGWQVYWDSWLANTPSTRVAEKVGFEKLTEYDIRLVML